MWFSGPWPWPLPIGNAVAMPWCVYIVARLTASITDACDMCGFESPSTARCENAYMVFCAPGHTPALR